MTLGIIGTAGRGPDGKRLPALWNVMSCVAQSLVVATGAESLVSGGAAWADHLAVRLFNAGLVKDLTLHLPASFLHHFDEGPGRYDCGHTANHYHRLFTQSMSFDSLKDIETSIKGGALALLTPGFKERNTKVAEEAQTLLAFTFGDGPRLCDGGTLDTMTKFLARRGNNAGSPWLPAYHFDLNSRLLYRL